MRSPSIRLTHKVMAIGLFGLLGLVAFGVIYEIGSLSQDASGRGWCGGVVLRDVCRAATQDCRTYDGADSEFRSCT